MSTSSNRQNAMYFFKNDSTSPSFDDNPKQSVSSYPGSSSSYKKKELKEEKTSPPVGSYPSSTTRSSVSSYKIKKELPTYPHLSHLLSTPHSIDPTPPAYSSWTPRSINKKKDPTPPPTYSSWTPRSINKKKDPTPPPAYSSWTPRSINKKKDPTPPGYSSWTPRSINKKELESPTKEFLETENELLKKQYVRLYERRDLEKEDLEKENQRLMEKLKQEKEKMNKMKNLNVVLKRQYDSLDSTREQLLQQLRKDNVNLKQKVEENKELEKCNKQRISELSIANTELYSQLEKQYYRYSDEWQQELDLLCVENNRLTHKLRGQNIELQKLHDEMKADLMKNHKTKIVIEEMKEKYLSSNKRKCPW